MVRKVVIAARTRQDLRDGLAGMRVKVRPLGDGQEKKDVERWAIKRLLATQLDNPDLFNFPMRVMSGERPDFILASSIGNSGVEVTQAVPSDLARIRDIRRRRGIREPYVADGSVIRMFDPRKPLNTEEVKRAAQPSGRLGLMLPPEETICANWMEAMLSRIEDKISRFKYDRSARDVLLIDDQWPTPGGLPEQEALGQLAERIRKLEVPFDEVFICREPSQNMLRLGRTQSATPIPSWV